MDALIARYKFRNTRAQELQDLTHDRRSDQSRTFRSTNDNWLEQDRTHLWIHRHLLAKSKTEGRVNLDRLLLDGNVLFERCSRLEQFTKSVLDLSKFLFELAYDFINFMNLFLDTANTHIHKQEWWCLLIKWISHTKSVKLSPTISHWNIDEQFEYLIFVEHCRVQLHFSSFSKNFVSFSNNENPCICGGYMTCTLQR